MSDQAADLVDPTDENTPVPQNENPESINDFDIETDQDADEDTALELTEDED